uniref:Uncharacterized protein n=1 Tax=Periophthalmus magnuspinnatus TaxID=409849 RepID=A0A3B4B497_9GOBI
MCVSCLLILFHTMPHPYSGGPAGGNVGLPDPPTMFFPPIPERPVSFSPPPTGLPKGYNNQRRKSTSILEAHTRHFQPTYPRYGSSLHPFSGMEGVEAPPLYMVSPSFAGAAQRLGMGDLPGQSEGLYGMRDMTAEHEEAVRKLSLNRAALLDHYEALAFAGYPLNTQLSLSFHQQRQVSAAAPSSLGYDPVPPPPGFLHAHLMQRMSAHSPIPPQMSSMGGSTGGAVPSSSEVCYPPAPVPTADAPSSSVFDFHGATAVAAVAGEPALLVSRLYRGRRSSMDLPIEGDSAGSGGSGSYCRLQPVTEELYSYLSPELPLPPGSLLLHHTGITVKDHSPDLSSDSLPSSDPGEFQSPPPQTFPVFDPSSAQSIPYSSLASYDTAPIMPIDPQAHTPSMKSFVPPTPVPPEARPRGASCSQLESLMQTAWPRHGGVVPAPPDMSYHESVLAMRTANTPMVLV